jgi:pre-mRNA-splicing factor ATP-dependent RNA helicase DHX38/PRP16
MAVLAKAGSATARRFRQEKDKSKMRDRFWEVAGSRIGDALGVSRPPGRPVEEEEESGGAGCLGALMEGSQSASDIEATRRSLPVYGVRSDLLRLVRENQVVVVVGETGSGKTTQLTQYLREAGYSRNGLIGCTQPRRVAAVSVAKRVADEVGCRLGGPVGYAIRFEDSTSPETEIKYMTDGVLLREALSDSDLDRYSVVVMDEAHERSINTDILFGVLKRVVAARADFRLIVTSATMDSGKFSRFFHGAPVFTIPGRTFPVEAYFSKTNPTDYVESAVDQALSVHINQPPGGDILIFMTGQDDIEATCLLLADRLAAVGEGVAPIAVLPIYSQLPADMQAKIFRPSPHRKAIVATNIAETSLTVEGIRYVIDCGFAKVKVYNPRIGMDSLYITPISRANANQRKGRAGRTAPGVCWRLYTENSFFYDFFDSTVPEIQRTNLSNVVLLLKSLGVRDLLSFDWMDPPPRATVLNSMHQLWLLGALDDSGDLTPLGRSMASFPLDPPLSRMILIGDQLGCAADMATIVSMLTVPALFFRPRDRAEESDAAREKFFVPESDHLTLLNVYEQYERNGRSVAWCNRHFIHSRAMRRVGEVRAQVLDIMKSARIAASSSSGEWDRVRRAVTLSYFHNVGKLRGIGEYVNLLSSVPCHLHPTSALFGLGHTPEYIVYHEVVKTTKEYMQCVTAVDPEWLGEGGSKFFYLRHSHADASRERQRDRETQDMLDRKYAVDEEPKSSVTIAAPRPHPPAGIQFRKSRTKFEFASSSVTPEDDDEDTGKRFRKK